MVVLAVVFRTGRSSGKPLLLPVLKKPPPGPPKPPPGPPKPPEPLRINMLVQNTVQTVLHSAFCTLENYPELVPWGTVLLRTPSGF